MSANNAVSFSFRCQKRSLRATQTEGNNSGAPVCAPTEGIKKQMCFSADSNPRPLSQLTAAVSTQLAAVLARAALGKQRSKFAQPRRCNLSEKIPLTCSPVELREGGAPRVARTSHGKERKNAHGDKEG